MKSVLRKFLKATCLLLASFLVAIAISRFILRPPHSPDVLLREADRKAWANAWFEAEPLYKKAEAELIRKHEPSKALYARVSQIPPHMEDGSVPELIWQLTQDLALPEAQDQQTKLRILTIRGMVESNYDGAAGQSTWSQVQALAQQQHQYLLASRALGEKGIAAYFRGDLATAKKNVVTAWTVAKYGGDPAAQVRYASVYGAGLVDVRQYKQALGPLNEAIQVAQKHHEIAYPTIAVNAKIEALGGLQHYSEALALVGEAMQRVGRYHLPAHLAELHQIRGNLYARQQQWQAAITSYQQAINYDENLSSWRGLAQVHGLLAQTYEANQQLPLALLAINEAIEANKHIPDELILVPHHLAIKADILARMGRLKASNNLYQKSADLVDSLVRTAPSVSVERTLVNHLSEVYSGYFLSLCRQNQYGEAFRVLEKARGLLATEALRHYERIPLQRSIPQEQRLTRLNLQLLETDDPAQREQIMHDIDEAELQLQIKALSLAGQAVSQPVELSQLQAKLRPSELLLEYVLSEPQSSVLAITQQSATRYKLQGKNQLDDLANRYRSTIRKRQTDRTAAQSLFNGLLRPITEYKQYSNVIVVADGSLHLLPFSALLDNGQYVIVDHTFSSVPSGTVFTLLRSREAEGGGHRRSYVGVAAWTKNLPSTNPILQALFNLRNPVFRAISGPEKKDFSPLPESRREVETIAQDLPKPSTILLGPEATETHFKQLPLMQYNVLHLALHGYADLDYPDRSALVFAPEQPATEDGLLQVREIRVLRLAANLVTLSACNTGVGPISQTGVSNLVNAFLEAGARSVISTLWETEDHAAERLMTTFYSYLAHQESKTEALRHAKLELLHAGMPPYYWAAFELVGDPEGVLPGEPNQERAQRV